MLDVVKSEVFASRSPDGAANDLRRTVVSALLGVGLAAILAGPCAARAWSGQPLHEAASPTSDQSAESSVSPEPPLPGTQDQPNAEFQRLQPFDVRFVQLERPRGSQIVRAVVTIRNVSERVQYLASGTFRAILTDADGAAQERNQIWQGSGEPAQLFNSTPALQPDGELTVRFTFNPDIRELDRLVLMRGEERIEFDLAGR